MTGIDEEPRRERYEFRRWDNSIGAFATQSATAPLHPNDVCLKLFLERREAD
jgi:hypothetical protein